MKCSINDELLGDLPLSAQSGAMGASVQFDFAEQRERVLFLARYGAHLHGTATDESDLDLVGVFLEPLSSIITRSDTRQYGASTGDKSARNTSDDVDLNLFELRTAVEKLLNNEPRWVELLYANPENVILTTELFEQLRDNSEHLHSDNVRPFVSYARSQANKYQKRDERLDYVRRFLAVLAKYDDDEPLSTFVDELPMGHKSIERTRTDEGAKRLKAFNREFDWNAPVHLIREALQSIKSDYGKRVRSIEQVDRKSLSHAYRLAYETEQYRRTGRLSFPLEQADYLRDIKSGAIDFDQARQDVQQVIDRARDADSVLPDQPDHNWAYDWLVRSYARYANDLPDT